MEVKYGKKNHWICICKTNHINDLVLLLKFSNSELESGWMVNFLIQDFNYHVYYDLYFVSRFQI